MAGNVPRQAPSPGPGPHQPNGIGGAALGLGGPLPQAGHQMDMNHLWNMVQELSAQLAENRAHVSHILNGVQQIQVRAAEDGASPTITEVNGELQANRAAELATVHNQLSAANRKVAALEASNEEFKQLVTDFENAMELILTKLRPYAYHHAQAINATKAHYNHLLEQERAANLQMRLQLVDWQDGLRRVNTYAREALNHSSEARLPYIRRIAGLKNENRTLRRLAGWPERDDSSDEEEDEKDEERAA
ncbi:hypothetical protein P152DRAFT_389862 [Eremomyces bilateralis CBS 781.70]|uniref:Uncharacterized protein n=1 Tax=Eremomyces bilateralis CBS 781.70 TaxID=1392243 RepID=A0A6G1GCN8_9PEZI|nr:uncharacterized protein P152DRAFT_389862 [Eremomyces bilateralis CBS 781.70]KAF1815619.1 hypothetical protein P152DRAFT_389862 [Eremomyces bilateralis CBS 781.70]